MKTQTIVLNEERNVTLTCYLQDVAGEFSNIVKRPAMIVLPGGGYSMCSDREADPVAFEYLTAGYQVFILRYSVKKHATWPNPLNDFEQAITLIKEKTDEWNVYKDKIAVIGFSAGGHLAASAATLAKVRPNAAILGYAVTQYETAKGCLPSAPDLVEAVDKNTPPCFLFATRTDNIVPISNTIKFIDALDRNGIMFETHIYGYGPHGFTVCNSSTLNPGTEITPRAAEWVKDSIGWLNELFGDFDKGQLSNPKMKLKMNCDQDEYLSVDCTMGLLMSHPGAQQVLKPLMEGMAQKTKEKYGKQADIGDDKTKQALGSKMTLRDALGYAGVPESFVQQLDEQLGKIKNS